MTPQRPPEALGEFYYLEQLSRAARNSAWVMRGNDRPERYINRRLSQDAREEANGHLGETLCVDSPSIIQPGSESDPYMGQVVGRFCDIIYLKHPACEFDGTPYNEHQEGLLMVLHTDPDREYRPDCFEDHKKRGDISLLPVESLTHIRTRREAIHAELVHEQEDLRRQLDTSILLPEDVIPYLRELAEGYEITGQQAIIAAEQAIIHPVDQAVPLPCRNVITRGVLKGFSLYPDEEGMCMSDKDLCYELNLPPGSRVYKDDGDLIAPDLTRCLVPVTAEHDLCSDAWQ